PHYLFSEHWPEARLDLSQVAVWPELGEEPLEIGARRRFFDSIHHSAAVVGINTSALIDAAVVGRPVHTGVAEEFRGEQNGTLHFRYLTDDHFGPLYAARTLAEHAAHLEESVRGRPDDGRNERFLLRFVRPFGLGVSATERVVEAIEELGARSAPGRDRGPAAAPLARAAL